ncbi:MAG TPA: OsmC family protein [Chitinophagaceae bacterium]|jgi:putative redox protein|nr:OsmC family protein [Chitinophagaceae bacterium]
MKTTTIWKGGEAYESSNGKATIEIDGEKGFNPKSLLLSGLAGCSGIDVVMILEKMRVPFADLKIDVETEQTDGTPRVFQDLHMTFTLRTGEENRDKVQKAVELSLDKYCGVAAMLQKHSPIHYRIIIQPE